MMFAHQEHSREDEDEDEEEDEEYEGDIEKKSGYIEEISEDALFIDTLKRNPDKFHEMLSNMSSIDNAGITRMLGWAAGTGQAPGVRACVRLTDFSCTPIATHSKRLRHEV